MKMGFGLTQEQTQKLMMTPELRLAIKILQLSTVELVEYIEQELVENPILEVVEETGEGEGQADAEEQPSSEREAEKFDIDWEHYFDDMDRTRSGAGEYSVQDNVRYESFVAQVPTLQDHLLFQLSLAKVNEKEKSVGEFFIGNIDDNGYLHCSTDEAAIHCGVAFNDAARVLYTIQGFDPLGVAARDLKECLLIQYNQQGLQNELLRNIIEGYLGEIADGKIMKVAKKLGVSLKQIQTAVDQLKLFDPKPGRNFSPSDNTRYIVPDVVVERISGEYIILVNDVFGPRITINSVYRDLMKGRTTDQEGQKYLETKLNSAVWLLRSIEQRRETLYKVARSIVDFQREFLDKGVKFLKPMNLKHVAEELGIHESTVSRATANKFMQTPRGVLQMKFFFSSGVTNAQGESTSAEAVKKIMSEMVTAEDSEKPLSDQQIVELLKIRGIDISRRTVAKYRDEMGVLPSSRRRRY